MRIAIVHDWLTIYGGAERVLEQMLGIFPDADLFSLIDFLPADQRGFIQNKTVATSFMQKLPWAKSQYRRYLALMPLAVEQFDLSAYNLVISSSYAVAKGALTGPNQLHLCMCYSPMRYAWDLQHQYLTASGLNKPSLKGYLAKGLLHYIRMWDARTANGVDEFFAISQFIARRIQRVYRRQATVIYPPVDVHAFTLHKQKENFYLVCSRLVPYKKVDLIVEAFSRMPNKQLVVIGDGPDGKKVRAKAGPNIKLLGYQPFAVLRNYMQRACAFISAAEEDFGIAPVEAQACGTPVIAYGRGGCSETTLAGETGLFFSEQSVDCLIQAVAAFESCQHTFDPERIRENAKRFCPERFRQEFADLVAQEWAKFFPSATPLLPPNTALPRFAREPALPS
jgi:glycosyltransferase involved in cell wall biosynthesis